MIGLLMLKLARKEVFDKTAPQQLLLPCTKVGGTLGVPIWLTIAVCSGSRLCEYVIQI
jgi:hypothetical protein